MAKYKVRVGVIGWIDPGGPWPMPVGSGPGQVAMQGFKGRPGFNWWVIKSYMGLMSTTNNPPPAGPLNFHTYRGTRDFRTMVWANLEFDDALHKTGPLHAAYVGSEAQSRIVDEGYTPPVNTNKVGAMAMLVWILTKHEQFNAYVDNGVEGYRDLRNRALRYIGWPTRPEAPAAADLPYLGAGGKNTLANINSRHWYRGQISPVSEIHRDKQHNNSSFPALPPGERLIANGVMRFRAGPHTDEVGMEDAGSEYHVPWVWAEFLLTYLGNGTVRLRGASSIFPTVAWYLDDVQVAPPHRQVGDGGLPEPFGNVEPQVMQIWPVLSAGAPKSIAQPPLSQDIKFGQHKTPITSMPWTCPGDAWVDVKKDLRKAGPG